jgi:hypothetical protein
LKDNSKPNYPHDPEPEVYYESFSSKIKEEKIIIVNRKTAIICLTVLGILTIPTIIGSLMCIYYIYHLTQVEERNER